MHQYMHLLKKINKVIRLNLAENLTFIEFEYCRHVHTLLERV